MNTGQCGYLYNGNILDIVEILGNTSYVSEH